MYREAAKAMLMDIALAWGKSAEPDVIDTIWRVKFTKFGDGSYGRYISGRVVIQPYGDAGILQDTSQITTLLQPAKKFGKSWAG
jgi:hypothetical protein